MRVVTPWGAGRRPVVRPCASHGHFSGRSLTSTARDLSAHGVSPRDLHDANMVLAAADPNYHVVASIVGMRPEAYVKDFDEINGDDWAPVADLKRAQLTHDMGTRKFQKLHDALQAKSAAYAGAVSALAGAALQARHGGAQGGARVQATLRARLQATLRARLPATAALCAFEQSPDLQDARFRLHNDKLRALDSWAVDCIRMVRERAGLPNATVLLFFGDWSGHIRMGAAYSNAMRLALSRVPGVLLVDATEFNTSQTCEFCVRGWPRCGGRCSRASARPADGSRCAPSPCARRAARASTATGAPGRASQRRACTACSVAGRANPRSCTCRRRRRTSTPCARCSSWRGRWRGW